MHTHSYMCISHKHTHLTQFLRRNNYFILFTYSLWPFFLNVICLVYEKSKSRELANASSLIVAQSVFHLFSMIFYWLYASFLLQIESSLYIASKVSKYFLSILLHHIYILPLIVLHSFGSLLDLQSVEDSGYFFISVSSYHLVYYILWNHHLYTYKYK